MSTRRIFQPATIAGVALLAMSGIAAACSPAATTAPLATPAPSPAASPTGVASPTGGASPSPAPVASATLAPSVSAVSGRWSVVATNPRVLIATGGAAGGKVTITGTRYEFSNMTAAGIGMRSSGPIEFAGDFDLQCTATSCPIPRTVYEIKMVAGALVIADRAMLTRYGSGTICGHPPIPGIGVVTVESQTTVQGTLVPAVVRSVGGGLERHRRELLAQRLAGSLGPGRHATALSCAARPLLVSPTGSGSGRSGSPMPRETCRDGPAVGQNGGSACA